MISQLWPALSILRMYRSSTDPGAYRLLSNGITIISNPRLSTPALHLLHPRHLSIASMSMTISILINSWRGSSCFFSAYSILKNSILNISYATPATSTPTPIQFVQCRLLVGSLLMKYLLLRFHSTFLDIISEKWCGDISDIRFLWLRAFIGQSGSENGGRESIKRVIAFCLLEFPIHMPRYSWIFMHHHVQYTLRLNGSIMSSFIPLSALNSNFAWNCGITYDYVFLGLYTVPLTAGGRSEWVPPPIRRVTRSCVRSLRSRRYPPCPRIVIRAVRPNSTHFIDPLNPSTTDFWHLLGVLGGLVDLVGD